MTVKLNNRAYPALTPFAAPVRIPLAGGQYAPQFTEEKREHARQWR